MSEPARKYWFDIEPRDAVDLSLPSEGIIGPLNEEGKECPWPWDPQQLGGAPLGQYRCPYCLAMCMAGMRHFDYGEVVLVTGSREWREWEPVREVLSALPMLFGVAPKAITIRDGAARGLDSVAHAVARQLGMRWDRVPVTREDWKAQGKAAGMIRNRVMIERDPVPRLCLAFPHPTLKSSGTRGCMELCDVARIPVWEHGVMSVADLPQVLEAVMS